MSTKKVPAKKVPAKKAAKKAPAKKTATKVSSKKAAEKEPAKKVATKAPVKKMAKKAAKKAPAKKAAKMIVLTQVLMTKAASTLGDKKQLKDLIGSAVKKVGEIDVVSFKENFVYLMAMVRLLKAYFKGEYREVPWKSLLTITGAVIYVVIPFDLIPDTIPGIGLIDDAKVVSVSLQAVKGDLDAFMAWETESA